MSVEPVNVSIVGAGPVGLTLACHLRRRGVSVRLVEKLLGPSQHSNDKPGACAVCPSLSPSRHGVLPDDFICLGRPDGHIGFIGSPSRIGRFVAYLGHRCDPEAVRQACG